MLNEEIPLSRDDRSAWRGILVSCLKHEQAFSHGPFDSDIELVRKERQQFEIVVPVQFPVNPLDPAEEFLSQIG